MAKKKNSVAGSATGSLVSGGKVSNSAGKISNSTVNRANEIGQYFSNGIGGAITNGAKNLLTAAAEYAKNNQVQTQAAQPVQQVAQTTPAATQTTTNAPTTYTPTWDVPALTEVEPYYESDEVKALRQIYQNYLDGKDKPVYESQYADTIKNLADKIANRKEFSYDFDADPMYQQYKDQYQRQAQLGMQNSMAQAAALTGGYGNSYASTAGNLAYQENMSQLNNVIPQLYQLAYDKYNNDLAGQRADLSMYQGLEDTDYGRYRDSVNDWNNDRGYYTDQYNNARNFDYGQYRDKVSDTQWRDQMNQSNYQAGKNYTADQYWKQTDYDYQKNRDAIADKRYEDETAYNRRRDDVSDQRYEAEQAYQRQQNDQAYQQWLQEYNRGIYESDRDYNWQKKVYKDSLNLKGSASGGSGRSGGGRSYSGGSSGSGISSAQRGVYSSIYKWKNGNEGQSRVAWDSLHGGVIGQKYGLTPDQADYLYYDYLGFKDAPGIRDSGTDNAEKNADSNYKYQSIDDVPKKYRDQVLDYVDFIRNMPSDESLRQYKSYPEYLTKTIKRLRKGN